MSDSNYGIDMATRALRPLAKFYDDPNLEEIVVNEFGKALIKMRGGDWEEVIEEKLSYPFFSRVCNTLANINGAIFSEETLPVVSCQVPSKALRFQAILGGNVQYNIGDSKGIALAIRSLQSREMKFDSWGLTRDSQLQGADNLFTEFMTIPDQIERLAKVIALHQTIIVSGATSTGKTTFTNEIIKMISGDSRVITVEDVLELNIPQKNHVRLLVQRNEGANKFTWNAAIDSLMRLTPDWVVCGELSVANAIAIFSLMGKGHPVITTVHASTPDEAMQAFISNMSSNGSSLDPVSTLDQLRSRVGCIIQLDRHNGRRAVTDIVFPATQRSLEISHNSSLN